MKCPKECIFLSSCFFHPRFGFDPKDFLSNNIGDDPCDPSIVFWVCLRVLLLCFGESFLVVVVGFVLGIFWGVVSE